MPQLRGLAERSWFAEEEPPPQLFRSGSELPDLDYGLLGIAGGGDFMAASLVGSADRLAPHAARPAPSAPSPTSPRRSAPSCAPCANSAGACPRPAPPSPILRWSSSATATRGRRRRRRPRHLGAPGRHRPVPRRSGVGRLALSRLAGRLGIPAPDLPDSVHAQLLDELVRRHRDGLSCDLDAVSHAP
ncbi:hypothetical protein [Streptomyces sp. KL116D]|uniref:hypothetical protein n=1 Tax=Streptomyces sp. KL116D TaxID=3045152 RepID=UPI003556748B